MKTIIKSLICKTLIVVSLLFTNSLFAQDPNIILIIADDMGWNQVSSNVTNNVDGNDYGSDFYETPEIDQLASEGIAFPYAYVNGGNCAPTRAALLSGQFAARPHNNVYTVYDLNRGNTAGNSNLIGPDMGLASNGNIDEIPASAITIAETMQTAGYTTAHFGKYHVGENEASNVSNNAPTDQGFDFNYGGGTDGGPGDYFALTTVAPYSFGGNIGPELDPFADPYTEAESIALSDDHTNYPLTGTKKHVTDAMAEAATDFMDNNSSSPFFMHFSNFAIHGPFNPDDARPDLRAKYEAKAISNPSAMDHDSKPGQAAIAEGMDQTVGRLINYLKTTLDPRNPGKMLSENTLVYFISDNGDAVKRAPQSPLRGMKGEYYEGGIRSVTFAWSEATWLANKGTVNTTPIVAFDLYPTFVEAAGGTLPGGGYDIDGESQWQMLTNGTAMTRQSMFWHHPGYLIDSKRDSRPVTVVRKGDYKLMHFYEDSEYELYHLINDIGETTNLLPSSDQAIIDIANDMITDMINHLTDTSAPLPTYRDGGATVPMPTSVSVSSGNSTDGCQAASGYEAYWDFDTTSDANDVSGNGHDPNPINGTLTYDNTDFKEGDQSVVFDGSVDINYSDATFLSPLTTARSISVWIKPTALSGNQNIIEEGGTDDGIALRLEGTNLVSMIKDSGTDYSLSTAFPNDGAWHHIAMVYDGSNTTQTIYIDGISAISGGAPASVPSRNTTGGGIGGVIGNWDSFGAAGTGSYFTGKMDAFALYDSVLTVGEVTSAVCAASVNSTAGCQSESGYEAYWDFDVASSANDSSGNTYDPVATTGALTYDNSDFKEGDQSVIFNGATKVQYNDGTFLNESKTNRTVSVWLKPDTLNGGVQSIYDEGSNWKGISIILDNNTIKGTANDRLSSGDPIVSVEVTADFDAAMDGEWHHVALVFEGGVSLTLYIDGLEKSTVTSNVPPKKGSANNDGGIGGVFGTNAYGLNSNTDDYFFSGKMDAIAVYNSALTVTQIETASCNAVLNVDEGGLFNSTNSVVIYPNPFKTQINIKIIKEYSKAVIEVFNTLGQRVYVNEFRDLDVIEIPIKELPSGQYFVKMSIDDVLNIKMILKE